MFDRKEEKMTLEKAKEITTEFAAFNDFSTKKILEEVTKLGPARAMEIAEAFTIVSANSLDTFREELNALLEKHPNISMYGVVASENPIGTGIRRIRRTKSAGHAVEYQAGAELQILADRLLGKNGESGIGALLGMLK